MMGSIIFTIVAATIFVGLMYLASATFTMRTLEREVLDALTEHAGQPIVPEQLMKLIGDRRSMIERSDSYGNPVTLNSALLRPDQQQMMRALEKLSHQGSIRYTSNGYLLAESARAPALA